MISWVFMPLVFKVQVLKGGIVRRHDIVHLN